MARRSAKRIVLDEVAQAWRNCMNRCTPEDKHAIAIARGKYDEVAYVARTLGATDLEIAQAMADGYTLSVQDRTGAVTEREA